MKETWNGLSVEVVIVCKQAKKPCNWDDDSSPGLEANFSLMPEGK